jgi:hypothetical protein
MIKTMTDTNDNEGNQLEFPIQLANTEEEVAEQYKTTSDDEIAARLRLRIAQSLNKVAQGQDVMDEELIDWINGTNALLLRGGYDPVPVDFRKFGLDQSSKPCLVSSTNI